MTKGFGPSISLHSFINLSMVFGKNNSTKEITELAKSRILLCERQF